MAVFLILRGSADNRCGTLLNFCSVLLGAEILGTPSHIFDAQRTLGILDLFVHALLTHERCKYVSIYVSFDSVVLCTSVSTCHSILLFFGIVTIWTRTGVQIVTIPKKDSFCFCLPILLQLHQQMCVPVCSSVSRFCH